MKRFAWVLALPYVVTVSTHPDTCLSYEHSGDGFSFQCAESKKKPDTYSIHLNGKRWFDCDPKDACEDLAEALNQAHERRTVTSGIGPYKMKDGECFKDGCNTCCKQGHGVSCTAMYCE